MYRYSPAGFTPRKTSLAIMNGRRYKEPPSIEGNQSASAFTNASIDPMNRSSGSSGIAIRRAESRKRAAFASGRNSAMLPSSWR